MAATVRPIAAGIPGQAIASDVTTRRAASIAMPRIFAGAAGEGGDEKASETGAHAR